MKQSVFVLVAALTCSVASGKEIALTFDDAPVRSSLHFDSRARTEALVRKLNELKIPPVMIFANPCKIRDTKALIDQLRLYRDRGDFIGNHTCNHLRFDSVGFDAFSKDAAAADKILAPLYVGQKFFRFPYLYEGKNAALRDKMRGWLAKNEYRNAAISVDNEDVIVAEKLNQAKALDHKVDYAKVRDLYVKHIVSSAEFFDALAVKQIGYSPKHVLLLHEIDTSVLYIDALVNALRAKGWKIIGIDEAYKDPLYAQAPKNTKAGNGIIAQLVYEKTGKMPSFLYYKWDMLAKDLDFVLNGKVP
jgi:peptidoglycan/xylan/chitin deacetylase (PgdA/CDA1 family)